MASICQLARFAEDGKVDGQTNYSEAAKLYRLALSLGYDTAAYLLRLHKDNHISPNNDEELATWEQASKRSSDGIRLPGRHAG